MRSKALGMYELKVFRDISVPCPEKARVIMFDIRNRLNTVTYMNHSNSLGRRQ